MRIRAARDHVLHADGTLFDRVDRLPPRYCGPLNRLAASRLLLPRSGLERSDFVHWPDADLVQRLPTRQLLGVKWTRYAHRELFRV